MFKWQEIFERRRLTELALGLFCISFAAHILSSGAAEPGGFEGDDISIFYSMLKNTNAGQVDWESLKVGKWDNYQYQPLVFWVYAVVKDYFDENSLFPLFYLVSSIATLGSLLLFSVWLRRLTNLHVSYIILTCLLVTELWITSLYFNTSSFALLFLSSAVLLGSARGIPAMLGSWLLLCFAIFARLDYAIAGPLLLVLNCWCEPSRRTFLRQSMTGFAVALLFLLIFSFYVYSEEIFLWRANAHHDYVSRLDLSFKWASAAVLVSLAGLILMSLGIVKSFLQKGFLVTCTLLLTAFTPFFIYVHVVGLATPKYLLVFTPAILLLCAKGLSILVDRDGWQALPLYVVLTIGLLQCIGGASNWPFESVVWTDDGPRHLTQISEVGRSIAKSKQQLSKIETNFRSALVSSQLSGKDLLFCHNTWISGRYARYLSAVEGYIKDGFKKGAFPLFSRWGAVKLRHEETGHSIFLTKCDIRKMALQKK